MLTGGAKLGPYEIVAPIGAGGMGEVYRARDTRLDRTVAIKILNSQVPLSAELKARFEREAKIVSQLQHPHICVLHDIGSENGTDFLVMEFLEGESLADRLHKGPLPLEQVLKIAIEIADALEKAHRAGIVHRDLKPGNVMLTKSGAKLLDFGLAKAAAVGAAATGSAATVFAAAMTMTSPASPLSTAGAVLGTVQYMSPEQITGQEADARSDIFAFGAMLYEMATGKRAFEGKTQSSVVGQILAVTPPSIASIQPVTPVALSRLVATCLEKDPDERFQTIHDVKLRLIEIADAANETTAQPAVTKKMHWQAWAAVAAVIVILGATAAYFASVASTAKQVLRATLLPPESFSFVTTPPDSGVPVLSPDGTTIAFVARNAKGESSLFVRALNSLMAQQLPGTNGAIHPFWSPDCRSIGFFADGKLKRIEANGGPTQELATADRGRGGAWAPDGTILFSPSISSPLMRVPATGGAATPATKLAPGETGHRWPFFLPDGKHYLLWTRGTKLFIAVGSLDSTEHTNLFENRSAAAYAAGHLLFARGDTLVAQPFSTRSLQTTGEAVPLAQHIALNTASYRGVFSVSGSGLLLYQSGGASSGWQMQVASRDGKVTHIIPDFETFFYPSLSPDGKRAVVCFDTGGNIDIWSFDLVRGTKTRLTFDPAQDVYPVWTPDGSRIYFASNRAGHMSIYSKAADGSGGEELVYRDETDEGWLAISADGRYLAFQRLDPSGLNGQDIWVMPLFGDRKPVPVVQTPFLDGYPALSPDGKWLAYSNEESRRLEVYITSVTPGGPKWQVSTVGGLAPKWRADGKELYFLGYDGAINAVDITPSGNSIALGQAHALFNDTLQGQSFGPYDVSRDGKQFLLNGTATLEGQAPLTLVTNWTAEMKK